MFRFTIRELVLLTLVAAMGVGWWMDRSRLRKATEAELLVAKLTNADVSWNGGFAGLFPHSEREVTRKLLAMGGQAQPQLVLALDDPNKFAAAHYILTNITKREFYVSASEWNGLRVVIRSDGATEIDPAQRRELSRRWRELLGYRPSLAKVGN